jgi:hypothetical protein
VFIDRKEIGKPKSISSKQGIDSRCCGCHLPRHSWQVLPMIITWPCLE